MDSGVLASLIPPDQALLRYELNTTVVWFIAALTIGTGILFGIFPALQATRDGVSSVLKGESRQTAGRGAARFRTILVTAQAAIALALLVLAGLFAKSLANIGHADLGLTTDHVISFRVTPGLNGYAHERTLAFIERVEDALAESPGITGVTTSTVRLLGGDTSGQTVKEQGSESRDAAYTLIGPGYFQTLRIPLLAGRDFTRADDANAAKVAIVNEAFAKEFHLGKDAVGKWMSANNRDIDTQIVGVVADSKYADVKEEIQPIFFRP